MSELLDIEVVYATPKQQIVISLQLPSPTTIAEAISASGILQRFPELDADHLQVGIFGKVTTMEQTLKMGDRVEIYRPLIHNPKEARRIRAKK